MSSKAGVLPEDAAVLIDFGSTYTKIRVVDLSISKLIATSQAATNVSNLVDTLETALSSLGLGLHSQDLPQATTLASSSAAGGLKIVAIGLTRELTTQAATLAALGAGGKLVGTYAGGLTRSDVAAIEATQPDLVILSGGTDGGNHLSIIADSRRLAGSSIESPIIIAGNRNAADEVAEILAAGGKAHFVSGNVLPSLDRLEVEACRELVREVFMTQIVRAKGLEQVEELIGRVIMPTPQAVLLACRLMSEGPPDTDIDGLGDLVAIDIGGATTDVYSIAQGSPTRSGTIVRGLPEPRNKRTVEGDLGVRINAVSLYDAASGEAPFARLPFSREDLVEECSLLATDTSRVPGSERELELDLTLAEAAALLAVRRHSGTVDVYYGPDGAISVQRGKDLSKVKTLVATGGVVAANAGRIENRLRDVLAQDTHSELLTPRELTTIITDKRYSLFAIGLLSTITPATAFRVGEHALIVGEPKS